MQWLNKHMDAGKHRKLKIELQYKTGCSRRVSYSWSSSGTHPITVEIWLYTGGVSYNKQEQFEDIKRTTKSRLLKGIHIYKTKKTYIILKYPTLVLRNGK